MKIRYRHAFGLRRDDPTWDRDAWFACTDVVMERIDPSELAELARSVGGRLYHDVEDLDDPGELN